MRWAIFGLCLAAAPVRADGKLVLNGRALLHEGPEARGYCSAAGSGGNEECDRVLTKVLSGYTYGRGYVLAGATVDASGAVRLLTGLHVDLAAGSLPGADLALGSLDASVGDRDTTRLRFTLFRGESLFVCRDAQTGELAAPIAAMFSRDCRPTAWLGVDAGALAMQWQVAGKRLLAEWLHVGPAVELFGNGFGYAHLLRSLAIALPFDVRSVSRAAPGAQAGTSFGFGVQLRALYRSPQWELRVALRHRTTLLGGAGALSDNSAEGELRVVRNVFVSDAIVMQAGISLQGAYSQRPIDAFTTWATTAQRYAGFAGIHLGWVHEAPDI